MGKYSLINLKVKRHYSEQRTRCCLLLVEGENRDLNTVVVKGDMKHFFDTHESFVC
jgi:hypothetical protein